MSRTTNNSTFSKDPDAVLDYQVDWSAWMATSETIASSTWILPTGSGVIVKNSDTHDTTTATIWLSGGTLGTRYEAVNRITTNQGRTEDQTLTFNVTQH